jgi:predicted dehydrogenase
MKLCADYGKAMLCEKALTVNAKEAKEALNYAKEKGVLAAEAMWVRYMPMTQTLKKLIFDKRIGEVVGITANLGYSIMHKERILRPELGGGALLDLGVYTLNFATTVLGDDVKKIDSTVVMHETGVDKQEFVTLTYDNDVVASLYNTAMTISDRAGIIYGTEGYIVTDNINNYEAFHIYNQKHELEETIKRPEQITGFEYQVAACKRALESGALECEEMPHEHSIKIMEIIDEIKKQWA